MGILADQVYEPGINTIDADMSDLPAGLYLYSFQAGDYNTTGRISVVR